MKKNLQRLAAAQVTVKLPHALALALALGDGALQVLNQETFPLPPQYHAYLALALPALSWLGISPLIGTAFRDALHLPSWVSHLILMLIGGATIALGVLPAASVAHVALAAALSVLLGLGFGPPIRFGGAAVAASAPAAKAKAK